MDILRNIFVFLGALGLAWRVGAVAPGNWLSGACTAGDPYTFEDYGDTSAFDLLAFKEWSVFNASSEAIEDSARFAVRQDASGAWGLDFSTGPAALGSDTDAYVVLGISADSAADPDARVGISLDPTDHTKLRVDNLYVKVRFTPSDATPEMDSLKEMYPSYAESQLPATGGLAVFTAPKLGLCVLQDGYFYVSRVVSGSDGEPGTGMAEDLTYEFCKSAHTYDEVGAGNVVVRIEFCTYAADAYAAVSRGFRIWVRNANDADSAEICVSEGLGYEWTTDAENGYTFDFSSLGKGSWLYCIDEALAASPDGLQMSIDSLGSANQIGFSATQGAFYAAWLNMGSTLDTYANLDTYDLASFAAYAAQGYANSEGLLYDWASRYGVTLTDYLQRKGPALRALAAEAGLSGEALTDWAFNAFLLDMDPADFNVSQRLTVTAIVPDEACVTLTVRGPEGCDLRAAQARAGRICLTAAESLDALPRAPKKLVADSALAFDSNGYAVITLPRGAVETPFMRVTLESSVDAENL